MPDFQPPKKGLADSRFELYEIELWHTIDGICLLFRLHPSQLDTHRRLRGGIRAQLHETLGGQARGLTIKITEIFIN